MAASRFIEAYHLVLILALFDAPGTAREISGRLSSDLGFKRSPEQVRVMADKLRHPSIGLVELRSRGFLRTPLISLTESGYEEAGKWLDFLKDVPKDDSR